MRESFDPEAKALVGDVDKPTQAFRPGRAQDAASTGACVQGRTRARR
jgi:hypothetical protein